MKRMMNLSDIALRLRRIRSKHNLTVLEISKQLDMGPNAYRKYERAKNFLSRQSMILLVEKFGISLDWLLFNRGPMYYREIEDALRENKERKEQEKEPKKQPEPQVKEPAVPEDAVIVTAPEIKELLQFMEGNPLFKHQLLTHFYNYKKETKKEKKNPFA